jgi:ankyrin repeat protein
MFANLFKPTDLWLAAKKDNVKAIEELVAAGHDVNARKIGFVREGYTPLHIAVIHNRKEAIRTLVKLGADVNGKNKEHETPLSIAVTELESPDIAEMLLDLGAKINAKRSDLAMTPLDMAASDGKAKMVKMLLDRGASPNVGTGEKRSDPIRACSHDGNVEILRLLLKAGADPNALHYGGRAVCTAAVFGHEEFVKVLLEAGADPNIPEESGTTPLISAVAGGKIEIVKLVVAAGAKLDAVRFSDKAETALDFSEWKNQKKTKLIADYLRGIGAKRASELPASETTPPSEDENETFWQLADDSVLTVRLEPWPLKAGAAKLKAEISTNGHDPNLPFSGTLEYRLASLEESSEPWTSMKRGWKDEDNNVKFSEDVTLSKGAVFLQFKVHPKWEKEPSVPAAWKIEVV